MKSRRIIALLLASSIAFSFVGCSLSSKQKTITEDDFYEFIEDNEIDEVDYDDVMYTNRDDYENGYYFECDYDEYIDWYSPSYDIEEFDHAIVIINKSATIVFYYYDDEDDAMEFLEDTADANMNYIEAYYRDDDDYSDEEYSIDGDNGYLVLNLQYSNSPSTNTYVAVYVFDNAAIAISTNSVSDGYKRYVKNFCNTFDLANPIDIDPRRIN